MFVGVTAVSMQGARIGTDDIDLWFSDLDDPRLAEAARRAGGLWVASKRAADRPKDRAALPALEAALSVIEDEENR